MACYTDEWRRTNPDFVVHLPCGPNTPDGDNQHFLVVPTPRRSFLAFWTQSTRENAADQQVIMSRSEDQGRSWSSPVEIAGPAQTGRMASWGFPVVVPHTGRVYCFLNQNAGIEDVRADTTGECWYRWSDDDGRTWSADHGVVEIGRCAISHPDPQVPPAWIVCHTPVRTARGQLVAGFTRWASRAVAGSVGLFTLESQIWFLRFDNIATAEDPLDLRVSTWPDAEHGLRVPPPGNPEVSVAQEPTVQPLPDGRHICVMRTMTGRIYFALSADGCESWDEPRPLRYCPGGPEILQPIAPCPLYRLRDGRYLLLFHNNDGSAHGGSGPGDHLRNRRPAFLAVGRYIDHPTDPLIFGMPRRLMDTDGVSIGPCDRTEVATYTSFFEFEGTRYLWYPDRKHFLLGRIIRDRDLCDPPV